GEYQECCARSMHATDTRSQRKRHNQLGKTLYERGDTQKSDDKKLSDWINALNHYEQTLKFEPGNKEAKENYDYVKKKIEELKNKKQHQQQPSHSPSPQQKNKQDQQNQQSQQDKQKDQQQQ